MHTNSNWTGTQSKTFYIQKPEVQLLPCSILFDASSCNKYFCLTSVSLQRPHCFSSRGSEFHEYRLHMELGCRISLPENLGGTQTDPVWMFQDHRERDGVLIKLMDSPKSLFHDQMCPKNSTLSISKAASYACEKYSRLLLGFGERC